MTVHHHNRFARWALAPGSISGRACLLLATLPATAAAAEAGRSALGWNLLIAVIVLGFTLASALLPVAAWRHWRGGWRGAALFPLLVLLLWAGLIVLGRNLDDQAHLLWPLEIFAWAMLNMIYMVSAMTIKRQFEKADQEQQSTG